MAATHLLIIGDREPLKWVVTKQRMAFPAGRSKMAAALSAGDQVLIYSTRSCFRNPTRDRGRVMARAEIVSPARPLVEPLRFGERSFTVECGLRIEALAPYRDGLVLSDLVPRLALFPDPASWSVRLRRAVVTLPPQDVRLITRELDPHLMPYAEAVGEYRTV